MVDKLIHYLYHFDYNDESHVEPNEPLPESDTLAVNAGMYIIGDRYNIMDLKELAKNKFSYALNAGAWRKQSFPDVIRTIYDNTLPTDRGLRDCLVPTLQKYKKELRAQGRFMKVVRTHGDFAVDLIDAWGNLTRPADRSLPEHEWLCITCGRNRLGDDIICPYCHGDVPTSG